MLARVARIREFYAPAEGVRAEQGGALDAARCRNPPTPSSLQQPLRRASQLAAPRGCRECETRAAAVQAVSSSHARCASKNGAMRASSQKGLFHHKQKSRLLVSATVEIQTSDGLRRKAGQPTSITRSLLDRRKCDEETRRSETLSRTPLTDLLH